MIISKNELNKNLKQIIDEKSDFWLQFPLTYKKKQYGGLKMLAKGAIVIVNLLAAGFVESGLLPLPIFYALLIVSITLIFTLKE